MIIVKIWLNSLIKTSHRKVDEEQPYDEDQLAANSTIQTKDGKLFKV